MKKLLLLTVLAAASLSGCSEDDPAGPAAAPTGPATPEALVAAVRDALEAGDPAGYTALLDPGYLTLLSPETIRDFPTLGSSLDLDQEKRIHQRMFSGGDVFDPDGNFVPVVVDIAFTALLALDAWAPTDEDVLFPGTVWAPFQVVIVFFRGQSYSTMRVDGVVKVYARPYEPAAGGAGKTYYLLAGMRDLTGLGKGSEIISWGSVKAMYR